MRWSLSQSVQATLAYAAIFEYPLTADEITRYLLVPFLQVPKTVTKRILLPYQIGKTRYYSLKDTQRLVRIRRRREAESLKKWRLLTKVLPLLTWIPTVRLIGVSGSLAVNNADLEDDIDLFIICDNNTIWITRLLVLFMLEAVGKRRTFGNYEEKDLFCLNMLMVSRHVAVPSRERDVFVAHEIIQLKPVFVVGDAYLHFLKANAWVAGFMPYGYNQVVQEALRGRNIHETPKRNTALQVFRFINTLVKAPQLWMINQHRTQEVITDTVLRFHPNDARVSVRKKFISLLQQKNIPLDSRFF